MKFHVSQRLSDIAVIAPVGIPIPQFAATQAAKLLVGARLISPTSKPLKQRHLRLNLITVPLFSVLLLLSTSAIDGQIIRKGIFGADGIKPLDIMALFISLVSIMNTRYTLSQRLKRFDRHIWRSRWISQDFYAFLLSGSLERVDGQVAVCTSSFMSFFYYAE